MQDMKVSGMLKAALTIIAVTLFASSARAATRETILHSFNDNGSDGYFPFASLISDAAGNLYGTTEGGGIHSCNGFASDCGTVFELSPRQGGGWSEKVLHSFNGTDGANPEASLIFDAAGNLYGTTASGGIHACNGHPNNCGTVFKLSPNSHGGWTESVLHSFGNGADGIYPVAGLIFDAAGNLYGTTENGGVHNCNGGSYCGTVFELSPNQGGGWTEKVLHSFGNGTDGYGPEAGVVFDAAGNLYGTTENGGIHNRGTVFEMSPRGGGGWSETVLHSFGNGEDGIYPVAGLIFDAAGNLYGTTEEGGIGRECPYGGCGTVFELTPTEGGGWTEKNLHNFGVEERDGTYPSAGLIFDAAGNLYGTTGIGGAYCSIGCGTVFELTPTGGGDWIETVLHSFGNGTDGYYPYSSLILDAAGNLYGTTEDGGIHGVYGIVFEITP
ncbi:MAG: choice-of-anchor tandem repeat GloVer-containing protein [Candidatus Korobacteraceae bacterium]